MIGPCPRSRCSRQPRTSAQDNCGGDGLWIWCPLGRCCNLQGCGSMPHRERSSGRPTGRPRVQYEEATNGHFEVSSCPSAASASMQGGRRCARIHSFWRMTGPGRPGRRASRKPRLPFRRWTGRGTKADGRGGVMRREEEHRMERGAWEGQLGYHRSQGG